MRQGRVTKREWEVAECIALGATSDEIASQLFLSADTVKTHKKNLSRKIDAHNIADITRWYFCKRFNISLNLKPIARMVVATCMLFLLGGYMALEGETDMIRTVRTVRTVRTSRARRSKEN